jgi:hypothetical protein
VRAQPEDFQDQCCKEGPVCCVEMLQAGCYILNMVKTLLNLAPAWVGQL